MTRGRRKLQWRAGGDEAWSPLDLDDLVAWWDASDLATITESGGSVSQWDDKSGNGHHLVQETGSAQPTTGARTQNGRNVLDFDGVTDEFVYNGFNLAQPFTIYLALIIDTQRGQAFVGGSGSRFAGQRTDAGNNGLRAFFGSSLNGGTMTSGPYIVEYVVNGSSSAMTANGATDVTGNMGSNNIDNLGLPSETGAWFAHVGLCEVIFTGAADDASTRETVRTYLDEKWAIT